MDDGRVLYASDDSPEAIAEAKAYCADHGLTPDDVRLVKRDGQTLVIDRGNAWPRPKPIL